MCGVVGVIPLNVAGLELSDRQRLEICLFFNQELLVETVPRGKDATGVAVSFGPRYTIPEDAPYWAILKQAVPSPEFISNDGLGKDYEQQDKHANMELLTDSILHINENRRFNYIMSHCRFATKGTVRNPNNNHPIRVGNIIGIHNGKIENDKKIFEGFPEMTRQGEVDSEALVQLVAHHSNDQAISKETMLFLANHIEGAFASLLFNSQHPNTFAYIRNAERPLHMVYLDSLGILLIMSEDKFLNPVLAAYEKFRKIWKARLPRISSYVSKQVASGTAGIIDVLKEHPKNVQLEDIVDSFPIPSFCLPKFSDKPVTTAVVQSAYNHNTGTNYKKSDTVSLPAIVKPACKPDDTLVDDYTDYQKDKVLLPQAERQVLEADATIEADISQTEQLVQRATEALFSLTTRDSKDVIYQTLQALEPTFQCPDNDQDIKRIINELGLGAILPTTKDAVAVYSKLFPLFFTFGFASGYLISSEDSETEHSAKLEENAAEARIKEEQNRSKY
jgi:hypothetical protein